MKHKEILEIKKRYKKDQCTFSRVTGCYVNGEKQIVTTYRETFLNLEESELHKYLDIAKKVLSGALGNNLLDLEFHRGEGYHNEKQTFLMQLKSSELKDDALLEEFYQSVIAHYGYTGNFLILLYHDAYDVMKRTSDNLKLDESEETYAYVLCAICLVTLSEPGLHYKDEEKKMRVRDRDWMVEAPAQGFLFPAFTDRSSNVHEVLYYTKNPKDPQPEIMEEVLGCNSKQTTALQREMLHSVIQEVVGSEEEAENLLLEVQDSLQGFLEEYEATHGSAEEEPLVLTHDHFQDLLSDAGASEETVEKLREIYGEYFGEELPFAQRMLDQKLVKKHEERKKEQDLRHQVETLRMQLEETTASKEDLEAEFAVNLQVKPEKVAQIKAQIIDGQRCIVIPLMEDEQAAVNGEPNLL